jgi:outer membrane lipoprotein-sorting protein
MNRIISFRCTFVLASVVLTFVSQVPAQIGAILERMEKHRSSLDTLKANITVKKLNPQVGDSDESAGKIKFIIDKWSVANSYIRIDFSKPREQTIVVNKGKFSAFTPKTNEAYTGSSGSAKVRSAGGGAFSILQMSKTELKNTFSSQQLSNETFDGVSTFHLLFTPRTKSKYRSVDVWVDVDGMIHKIREVPINGDETTIGLTSIEKNKTIDKSEFEIRLPDGVKAKPL